MRFMHYFIAAALSLTVLACERKPKTVGEKIGEKVDDALDRRPAEKLRDAGEDVKDAAKDAKDAAKDAVK
jgi:hypothetical protein